MECNLTFDVDYWWDGPNSVFYMKEGSRINVESNVEFYNMSFLSCDNWWESIVVRNGGAFSLAQQGNRPKIKDAIHGIRLMNHSRAYLDGVDFEDNFIGIHSPSTSNGSAKNAILSVRNSKFTENNYILPPFISPYSIDHPYAAIELNDVHSTWLNECPSGPLCGNLIEKMYHGIILRNVDASLQGFIIRNLYDDPNDLMAYANTGIMATSGSQNQYHSLRYTGYGKEDVGLFQDLGIGIQQMGGIDKRLIVESNKIYAKNCGILSSFNQNGEKRIYDNEILHYQLLGSENATMPVQIGIGLVNNVIWPAVEFPGYSHQVIAFFN